MRILATSVMVWLGAARYVRAFSSLTQRARPVQPLYSTAADSLSDSKARVLFLGTPEVAATSLKTIHEDSLKSNLYNVVGVVTQPPKRRKRKGKEIPSPVGYAAEELGIPVLCPEKAKDPDFLDDLENNVRPDLCITAAYGQYLPKRFLAIPKLGTVNIHPSLLPRWRGASPVQRSLEAGDNPVGVSVLYTVSKMDAGPVIAQVDVDVDENDRATTVLPMLFDVGTQLLVELMPYILSGNITMETATEQDETLVTSASMIDASEAELRVWEESALECHNRMRGFSMWPGTFLYLQVGDEEPIKVKLAETRVLPERADPTAVLEMGPNKGDGLRLVCGDGSILEILKLQPVTRKVMDAKSFVNGIQGKTVQWVKPEENSYSASVAEFAARPFVRQALSNPYSPTSVLSFFLGVDFNNPGNALREGTFIKEMDKFWFGGHKDYDALCQSFCPVIRDAGKNMLPDDPWNTSVDGKLGQIILCDQLSRNCFRETDEAYAYDDTALETSRELADACIFSSSAPLKGEFYPPYATFVVTAMMHSESRKDHEDSLEILEWAQASSDLDEWWERQRQNELEHKKVIDQFGRYPYRNKKKNRQSTPEELAWLAKEDELPGWAKSQM